MRLDVLLFLLYLLGWFGIGWLAVEFLRKIDQSAFGWPLGGW